MSEWQPKMHDAGDAIAILTAAGIPVREEAYGFSVTHPELAERNFAE